MKLKLITGLSFLLFACDPGHETTSTIENNSGKQIILISQTFNANKITLAPGESKIIKHSGPGGYKYTKEQEFCPCGDEDIQIYSADSTLKITKNIVNAENWTRTSKRKYIKCGVFICKFSLTDGDIK